MRMEGDSPIFFQALRNPRTLFYFSRKISSLIENSIRSFSPDGRNVTGFFASVRRLSARPQLGGFVKSVCSR